LSSHRREQHDAIAAALHVGRDTDLVAHVKALREERDGAHGQSAQTMCSCVLQEREAATIRAAERVQYIARLEKQLDEIRTAVAPGEKPGSIADGVSTVDVVRKLVAPDRS